MRSADFLDALRARRGLKSDNQVAKYLGLDQGRVSSFRTGRREFTPEIALQVAAELDVEAGWIVAEIKAACAKSTAERHVWRRLAQLARKSAAAVVVGFALLLGAAEAPQAAAFSTDAKYTLYAYAQRRRLLARLLRLLLRPNGSSRNCITVFFAQWRQSLRMVVRIRAIRRAALVLALPVVGGCGALAEMPPSEAAWQALHLIDVAQTLNGPAQDSCYRESNFLTREIIGKHPDPGAVIAWGIGAAAVHYLAGQWLDRSELPRPVRIAARALDLGAKGFTVGNNHAIGMRPFGDNRPCEPWH